MKLRLDTCTFASAVFAIITAIIFFTFSMLFSETIIFYLGIPFALSLFFFSLAVLRRDNPQLSFKIMNAQIIDAFLHALTISSIIIVLFVPAYEGSMLGWVRISPLNWLRYLSSLLLTSFLPGYFLLRILDRKHAVDTGIVIVLSYLLSLFMTFLAGFSILLSANSLGSLGLPIIIATNIFLSITYYLTNRREIRNHLVTINWLELGLISSLLTVIALGSVITMINNAPLTPGDMQVHYGTALNFIKGFPVYGGKMITYSGGYLFAVYLDGLFVLSGIPPALALQGLYILSFMPLLAFYSSIKAWFSKNPNKRLPLMATSLSILLGFGGLYALYLRFTDPAHTNIIQLLSTATSKTYDIYMRILYLPDIVAPFWSIGLPVFFTLLYFLEKDRSNPIRATIIPILVALGYMGHTSEVIIFIIPAFIYTIFFRKSTNEKIGPYLVLGLVIVALVDLAAPVQVFISSGVGAGLSLPFVVSLILAVLTSVAELVKDRCALLFSMHLRASLLETLRKSWRYGRWVLVYVYVFFFITWLTIENNFDLWAWGGYSFTPFFVFPLRFGAVGLLVIISTFIYFSGMIRDRRLLFFLLLIPAGFVLEQLADYYLPYYPAYRYGTLAFVGACMIAGYGIMRLIDNVQRSPKLKRARAVIVSVLLGFLMISGMLTTVLFYVNASYYSANSKISQDELDTFDYIRRNIMSNVSVLSFTTESANELRNFAGLNAVQDAQRWSELLLSTSNPYIITYVLSSSNMKYIYVAQRDVELLNSSILNSIVKYFPRVFKNDYATIYEVSPLTAPSSQASFGVFDLSLSLQGLENTTWIDSASDVLPSLFVSLLHSKYTVLYIDNVLMGKIDTYLPDYTNILLTSDPPIPVESLLKWVSVGNTLAVINIHGNGFLADLFGINSSSPLLSINSINSGKVLYINSFPKVTAGKESEILQPEFLKQVRELLNLEEHAQSVNVLPVYNSISGSVNIQGDLKVDTDILVLQGAINLTRSPFSVNESTRIIMYGKINLTIENATLVISPSESYVLIKPESNPVEGEILVDSSEETLIVADANPIYNSDKPISFKFKTTAALSLYVRLPSINASGIIIFDQLDVHSSLYVPLAGIVQQPAEIQGSVEFDTKYISNPITIFSMFHAEGKILDLAETTAFLRPTIPWIEVITSPINIAFNAAFLSCIAVYIVKKRNAKAEKTDAQENSGASSSSAKECPDIPSDVAE